LPSFERALVLRAAGLGLAAPSAQEREDLLGEELDGRPVAPPSLTPPRPGRPVGPPGSDTRAVLDELGFDSGDLIARDVARDGLPEGTTFVGMFR
jgi:hypothetical protein